MTTFLIAFGCVLLCFGLFLAFTGLGAGWALLALGGILVALAEYLKRNQTHSNNMYDDQIKHNQRLREVIEAQKKQIEDQAEQILVLKEKLSLYEDDTDAE